MNSVFNISLIITVLFGTGKNLIAQTDFYDSATIQEIRLYFTQSNWDEILDSLYIEGDGARLGGDVAINNTLYNDVGVRYKGFSSFSTDRAKNPFNIELDYVYKDQSHQGYTKIKLSNVIQDPSFVREVLSYEIARKYMPASKANYANVYVNDVLIGLYTNVASVENDFLTTHFGSDDNTFIKCNPENLELTGENSNLSDSPGADITNYYPLYKLKSDGYEGWGDLYEFIEVLNNSPQNIASYLNVDRTLWMHAFNYSLINFDSYIGYAQNYYLYRDNNGRFNPIIWDLNMSFASYRLTDASDYWSGFSIAQAKIIDPLQHVNSVSVQPRPLIRNILADDTYKKMYIAHIRTIIEENIVNQEYAARAQYYQSLIDSSVMLDTNKFYTYADFIQNIDTTVSDLIEYPGIIDLMDGRAAYLSSCPGYQGAPDITNIDSYPSNTFAGDTIWIRVNVTGSPTNVMLAYRFSDSELFQFISMVDDGTQNDGAAGDSIYGASITNIGNMLQYYIYAENDSSGRFSPERAAYEFYEIESKVRNTELALNEIMANNSFTVSDQNGESDNWIELFNNTLYSIPLTGMYLSNEGGDMDKWTFPDAVIAPGAYFMIWADGDTLQTGVHTNFELSVSGGELWLSYTDGTVIDSVFYEQQHNVSTKGRYPNGTGNFVEMPPTFSKENSVLNDGLLSDEVFIYPNPANEEFNIRINHSHLLTLNIATIDGKPVISERVVEGTKILSVSTLEFAEGIYLVHVTYNDKSSTSKLMINH